MRNLLQYSGAGYLLILMLIKMMGMELAVLDYTLHKDFIAARLCENRAVPELKCAGKCYLRKQLTRTNQSGDSQEEKGTSKSFSVDFCESLNSPRLGNIFSAFVHYSLYIIARLVQPFLTGIFHPPLRAAF